MSIWYHLTAVHNNHQLECTVRMECPIHTLSIFHADCLTHWPPKARQCVYWIFSNKVGACVHFTKDRIHMLPGNTRCGISRFCTYWYTLYTCTSQLLLDHGRSHYINPIWAHQIYETIQGMTLVIATESDSILGFWHKSIVR